MGWGGRVHHSYDELSSAEIAQATKNHPERGGFLFLSLRGEV